MERDVANMNQDLPNAATCHVGRKQAGWMLAAVVTLIVCLLMTIGTTTLTVTKAVTAEESVAAEYVQHLHFYLMHLGAFVGVAAVVASAVFAVRACRTASYAAAGVLVLGTIATAVGCWSLVVGVWSRAGLEDLPMAGGSMTKQSVAAVCVAAAAWALMCWRAQGRLALSGRWKGAEERIRHCLASPSWRGLLTGLPGILLASVGLCVFVCTPLSCYALRRAGLEGWDLARGVMLSVIGLGLFALGQSLVLAAATATLAALVRNDRLVGKASLLAGLTAGATLTGAALWGMHLSFGSELGNLGMTNLMAGTLVVVGLGYGVAFSGALLELCRTADRPKNLTDLIRIAVVTGVLLPVLPIARRAGGRVKPGKLLTVLACAAIGLILAANIPLLFPLIEDFFDRIRFLLTVLIVLLTVLLGCLSGPIRRGPWQLHLVVLIALAASGMIVASNRQSALASARPAVFRHDPLGRYSLRLVESLLRTAIPPKVLEDPPTITHVARCENRPPVLDKLQEDKPLIVLIIWDAARPDHMSLFGYDRDRKPYVDTTPCLDKHKDEFLRFSTVFSQATGTTCSMRHLFTSRYSSRWMLKDKGIAPFWTNDLIRAGYDTFHMNIIGSDYNGISLEAFSRDMPADLKAKLTVAKCRCSEGPEPHATDHTPGAAKFIECNTQNEDRSVEDLLALLKARGDAKGRGVFAYIHMDLTHTPWPHRDEVPDLGNRQRDRYDQSMMLSDKYTGQLIDGLKKLGIWEDTWFILTADHGTGLGEHHVYGGFHPYFEQIHVPLVMKIPGVPGRKMAIDEMVGLFDMGPTLMEVFAPETLSRYEATSLWPLILENRSQDNRVLFGLSAFDNCYFLIRADGWHYIHHLGESYEQMYRWTSDYAEAENLIFTHPHEALYFQSCLNWFLYDYGKDRSYNDPSHYAAP